MAIKMHLIKTPYFIYGTYHRTICAVESHTYPNSEGNIQSIEAATDLVKLSMFNYAMTFGTVTFIEHKANKDWMPHDVFNFLEQQTK
jgi:hypothetical protein